MKQHLQISILFLLIFTTTSAQKKQFSLQEIGSGAFQTRNLQALTALKNGSQYAVLTNDYNANTSAITIYDYKTAQKVSTVLDSKALEDIPSFQNYTFSSDETKLLLTTNTEPIYRHSSRGIFYVYDTIGKTTTPVSDAFIQEPTFSPDGNKIAYVFENNIYVKNLTDGTTQQLTTDGEKNSIINGITDWVYEEEFAVVRAFDWNSTSTALAYIRFDETQVPEFSMDVYGTSLYPERDVFKYPKAGEKNAEVSVFTYSLETKKNTKVPLKGYRDFYIPRIKWTKNPKVLSVQVLNRHQNALDLLAVDLPTNTVTTLLQEKDDAYIDITDHLTFLEDHSFLWTSEKSGYNHIYHYDKTGTLLQQVTKGNWEVTAFYGYNPKTKIVYYESVENGNTNRAIYAIKINGKSKKKLSTKTGVNKADFSADYSVYINAHSNTTTPPTFTLHDSKNGALLREIQDNDAVLNRLEAYTKWNPKEFATLPVNGEELNMWMIKPSGFDPSKSYPMLLYQYSGPGSQLVQNSWRSPNDYWFQILANEGYIVACVDGRGTGFKGAKFKKVTQDNLGKLEVLDQIEAARQLGKRPYINAKRIGIWGWSYGGFMSSNCLFKAPNVFKMGIAVAPVTSWRFYDTIYTERYLKTPQENAKGYDENSPLNYVDQLQGKFLVVHGTADDNVHVQHTMRLVEALIQANKDFDWAIYPDKNHGIYGGNTRLHLYRKMTNFIKENL